MTFKEVLNQVTTRLQKDQRISYRAMKIQFSLYKNYINYIKRELTEV